MGFTSLIEPIASEMGWSYTQISVAASLRNMEASLLAPLTGILVDRYGPRRFIIIGGIITSVGLLFLSNTNSLAMFYVAFVLLNLGTSGYAFTVIMTTIAQWFREKMGTASGIVTTGWGIGGLLIPVLVRMVDTYSWRNAMMIVAAITFVLLPSLAMLFRHKPEQYGLLPDGEEKEESSFKSNSLSAELAEPTSGIKQALKTKNFWFLAIGFMMHFIAVGSVNTHVMPYLSSVGIARLKSGFIASAVPLASIIGRLGLGWLGDKVDKKIVASAAFIMTGLGLVCFEYISETAGWLFFMFVIFYSVGWGGVMVLRPVLIREYFGKSHFGSIIGFMSGITMLGTVVGAPLAGWVYDTRDSYHGVWFAIAALHVIALVLILQLSHKES
jgi:MFS family permease